MRVETKNLSNHSEFITQSESERDNLVYFYGFRFKGMAFASSAASNSNTLPVYRLYNPYSGK